MATLKYKGTSDIRTLGKKDGLAKNYEWKGQGAKVKVEEDDAKIILEKCGDEFVREPQATKVRK